jgi:hypothetical protein
MPSWNPELLDKFYAPGISTFTECDAPDIEDDHPEAPHWLANYFLNSVFRAEYKPKFRQYVVNQIYRAQAAFADYHEARSLTLECLARGQPHSPVSRLYFKALARWESCLLNIQIFIDVLNKMKKDLGDEPVFKESDGTPEQRAYRIANDVKHWGGEVYSGRHDDGDSVPMWLTNAGLETKTTKVTYAELSKLVGEVAKVAVDLQDAKAFGERE